MKFPELIRYLENKLSIRTKASAIRRQLQHVTNGTNPRGRECMALLQRLHDMRKCDPGIVCSFRTQGVFNSLEDIWWSFPKWLDAYHTFGRVPGVCIDGKFAANRFGLPLVSLTGWYNEGHVKLFAMGFLRAEDESSIMWFLKEFVSTVRVTPKVVFTGASASIIGAVKKVLPETFVLLDEWHLNQRQHANVTGTLRTMGKSNKSRTMEGDLFRIRRSTDIYSFRKRRQAFEWKWFGFSVESADTIRAEHSLESQSQDLASAAAEDMFSLSDFLRDDGNVRIAIANDLTVNSADDQSVNTTLPPLEETFFIGDNEDFDNDEIPARAKPERRMTKPDTLGSLDETPPVVQACVLLTKGNGYNLLQQEKSRDAIPYAGNWSGRIVQLLIQKSRGGQESTNA